MALSVRTSAQDRSTPYSTYTIDLLRIDLESVAHYRQESLKIAAARIASLSLFCHALVRETRGVRHERAARNYLTHEFHAARIFNPQYATTTARTTQAVSNAVSRAESLIGLLSFAHPVRNLCDSISGRLLAPLRTLIGRHSLGATGG